MRGVGAARAKGFWADAWDRVIVRFGARLSLAWIGTIAFFAIFAPIIANAHPMFRTNTATGAVDSPLWTNLTSVDLVLLAGGLFALPWYYMPASWGARFGLRERGKRLGFLLLLAMQGGATVVLAGGVSAWSQHSESVQWIRDCAQSSAFPWIASTVVGVLVAVIASFIGAQCRARLLLVGLACVIAVSASSTRWSDRLVDFDTYDEQEAIGEYSMVYTLIPFSPSFGRSDIYVKPPMTQVGEAVPALADRPIGQRTMFLGSDALGKDVLAQMMWACRLSISIGLVSTGLSVLIGVTMGAIMGFFGGWVDLLLFRVVHGDSGALSPHRCRCSIATKHLRDDGHHRLCHMDGRCAIYPRRVLETSQARLRARRASSRITAAIDPFQAHAAERRDACAC